MARAEAHHIARQPDPRFAAAAHVIHQRRAEGGHVRILRVRSTIGVQLLVSVALTSGAVAGAGAQGQARLAGRVVDAADQQPIPAAAVLVTGTTVGALTNDSGVFTLRVPSDAKSLTVRRIGFLQSTVPISSTQTEITIPLHKDVLRLEAQIVTGTNTSLSSKNAANAVSVVSAQSVTEVPSPTMENSIQGKIPGAIIQSNNGGAPGGGLQIQVRGVTSINGNAAPLYVVDGVVVNNETINNDINAINQSGGGVSSTGAAGVAGAPSRQDNGVNRIADINPADIENIEVLKGASASAIYGSKASAGVIIITTKRGAAGKARWDVNNQVGHYSMANTYPIRQFPTLGGAQAWFLHDVHPADAGKPAASADSAFIKSVYAGPQDYQHQLFGNNQLSYQTNISVSGSTGGTQYFLSGLGKYDNGIMNNTGYNKQSIRSNVTQQFSGQVSVTANLNYIHDVTRRGITGNDNIGISPYNVFSYTPAFVDLSHRRSDGTWPINPFGPANPFADAAEISTPEQVSRFIGGGRIDWTLLTRERQSLVLNFQGGADLTSVHDLLYAPPDLQVEQVIPSGQPGAAVSNVAQINYFNYSINLTHHYTGSSWVDATTSAGFARDRRDLQNPVTVGFNLLAGPGVPTVGTVQQNFYYRTAQRDQSFYFQEQILTLDQHLTVVAGVAAERSTGDGDIHKFYAYPHFSGSYRLPQFVGAVDELKLRVAYGQSGNLAPYGAKYTPLNPTQIGGQIGYYNNAQQGDPNIKPESEAEIETGLDATFFKSRAQFSATVYRKSLTNLLLQASVAPSLGYQTHFLNGGKFTNEGIELSLQATPVQVRNGLTWTTGLQFYRNYSVVNSLPVPPFQAGNTFGFGDAYLKPGRSVSEIVNLAALGPDNQPKQIGDFLPGYRMSFSSDLTWGAFRVYGLLDYSRDGNTINLTDLYYDIGPQLYADTALGIKRLTAFGNGGTPYVQNATFLKVRQLAFSYTLPNSLISRVGGGRVTSARITVTGNNLIHVYGFKGLDPEVSINGNQTITRGQDITPYPPAKSVFVGLDLGL